MDNETKLSKEQVKKLIDEFKNSTANGKTNVDEFAKKHLTEEQTVAFKNLLNNPQLIKSILASDKAKEILKKLKGDDNES